MRHLIFGDVHGNLPALEKLLEIEKNNYDQMISHGDVVNYGPWGNECVQLLDTIPELIPLKGNHETNFLNGAYSGMNEVAKSYFDFCYPKFTELEIIRKYGEQVDIKKFRVKHTVDNAYVYPDTDLSQIDLDRNYIIGHSHYQFDRYFMNKRIINTGSIGQNRKYINLAEYLTYDDIEDKVELKSFDYDIDLVINKMESDNYPELCVDYYKNKSRKE